MAMILVEGQVLDARGRPVAGARISWVASPVDLPDVALLADAQGRFSLAVPVAGNYTLRADSDAAGSGSVQIKAAGAKVRTEVRLRP